MLLKEVNSAAIPRCYSWLIRLIATLTAPTYIFAVSAESFAAIPVAARIVEVVGTSELGIRRGAQYGPANRSTIIRQHEDTLIVPASGRSSAGLRFFARRDRDLGLFVHALTRNELQTLYYFPCTYRNGEFIIQWENLETELGCEEGIRVRRSGFGRSELPPNSLNLYAIFKQHLEVQASRQRFQYYCVVQNVSGKDWLAIEGHRDPCRLPVEECLSENSVNDCQIVVLDRWQPREPDLTTKLRCENDQILESKNTGSRLGTRIIELWEQTELQDLKFCSIHILSPTDVLIIPEKNERNLVRSYDGTGNIVVEVIEGTVTVVTASDSDAGKPNGVKLSAGQRFIYSGTEEEARVEAFDADIMLQTEQMQEFIEMAKLPIIPGGAPSQLLATDLANEIQILCDTPPPDIDDNEELFLSGRGPCFYFQKLDDQVLGEYFYPNSGDFICVVGELSQNIVSGQASRVSWSGHPEPIPLPQEQYINWDINLKVRQGNILASSGSGEFGSDLVRYRDALLDLSGMYIYPLITEPWLDVPANDCNLEL